MNSKTLKGFTVGAVAGIVSMLIGMGAAKAECSQDFEGEAVSYRAAMAQLAFCHTPTSWAERDGEGWVAVCGTAEGEEIGTPLDMAELRCDEASQGWIEDGLTEAQVGGHGGMYEACMRLSVPPMVLSPAQHYDTTDGAFWKVSP